MKELTIEEKAARYDLAIEVAKRYHNGILEDVMELIFHELEESEDERIRKELIDFLKEEEAKADITSKRSETLCKYIVWLEKQGEKIDLANKEYWRGYREGKQEILDKYADFEKQSEQKPAVEMKTPEESLGIDSDTYNKIVDECVYGEKKSTIWSEEDELHIRELESLVKQEWAMAECENDKGKIHKMSDLSFFLKTLKPQLKQEWSEEDEKMLNLIIARLHSHSNVELEEYSKEYDWLNYNLKSLKEKVLPQPKQEWSEEDERKLQLLIVMCDETKGDSVTYSTIYREMEELKTWLKSLRPHNTWKPSDRELDAILTVIGDERQKGSDVTKELLKVYHHLKKLKE